jgi:hypothetical protein
VHAAVYTATVRTCFQRVLDVRFPDSRPGQFEKIAWQVKARLAVRRERGEHALAEALGVYASIRGLF